jgi:putative transposase
MSDQNQQSRVPGHDLNRGDRRNGAERLNSIGAPSERNDEWAVLFLSDLCPDGRRLEIFSVVDSYTGECLVLKVSPVFRSHVVVDTLVKCARKQGAPMVIRGDQRRQLRCREFRAWCDRQFVDLIERDEATESVPVQIFRREFQQECLNLKWFWNMSDARKKLEVWRTNYNWRLMQSRLQAVLVNYYESTRIPPSMSETRNGSEDLAGGSRADSAATA